MHTGKRPPEITHHTHFSRTLSTRQMAATCSSLSSGGIARTAYIESGEDIGPECAEFTVAHLDEWAATLDS